MLNKISIGILATILLIVIVIGFMKFFDHQRITGILINVIGDKNYVFVNKIDQKVFTGIGGSDETYIYKIEDTTKVNCSLLNKYSQNIVFLGVNEEDYIDQSKPFCSKKIPDKHKRHITLTIQNDILILGVTVQE